MPRDLSDHLSDHLSDYLSDYLSEIPEPTSPHLTSPHLTNVSHQRESPRAHARGARTVRTAQAERLELLAARTCSDLDRGRGPRRRALFF